MDKLCEMLKKDLPTPLTLAGCVDAFERMCAVPMESETDMLLFETGTFHFTGEKQFYFCLVRQCDGEDDEFTQLHLELLYAPTPDTAELMGTRWSTETEDFFGAVRESEAYRKLLARPVERYMVYWDET